jgi:hypothetical protein
MAALRSEDEYRTRAVASRAAQGLPPTITDLAVLERVAAVFARQPVVVADDVKTARKRTARRRAA